jgi:hypothetical protein
MLEIINPAVIGGGLSLVVFFGILAFLAIGRLIGQRILRRHGAEGLASTASLETAVFALLGLLIAFTFSGALSRFDVRRAQVVDEANAIGTAYLRIDLLPAPAQSRLREAFRNYTDARIATYKKLPDLEAARQELERSMELQADIWAQAVAATQLPESRPGSNVLVMPALNEMFDITTVRLMATQMHPPVVVFIMLIGLAFASALLAGYQTAGDKGHNGLHKVGFAAIVALTVYVIIDIEYPRLGFIRIDAVDQVLINVRAGMK